MNEDEEVVIAMKVIKDENDEEILVPVESDFEIEMIEEAYATLFADEEEEKEEFLICRWLLLILIL